MCVCAYVCMCVCMCACMRVCMYVCVMCVCVMCGWGASRDGSHPSLYGLPSLHHWVHPPGFAYFIPGQITCSFMIQSANDLYHVRQVC